MNDAVNGESPVRSNLRQRLELRLQPKNQISAARLARLPDDVWHSAGVVARLHIGHGSRCIIKAQRFGVIL